MAGARAYPARSLNELINILRAIDLRNPVVRYMLELSSRTGLRNVDVSNLKWSDVMINGVFRDSVTIVQSKSYNRRVTNAKSKLKPEEVEKALPTIMANARSASSLEIRLTDEVKELLKDLQEFTGDKTLLFESTHHNARPGSPISIQYVNNTLKSVAIELGLPYQLSTHSMRKTFAQFLLQGDANIKVLRNALGQASISSTQHYIDTFVDDTHEYTGKISYSVM